MPFTASDICKILLAIILPPVGVFLERGCNADFLINILLTVLGYIPVSSAAASTTNNTLLTLLSGYHPRSVHHIQVLAESHIEPSDEGITIMSLRYPFSVSFGRPRSELVRGLRCE